MDTTGWTPTKIDKYDKALKYLSNPDNEKTKREDLAVKGLGYTNPCGLYKAFTPDEIVEIYNEALAIRRKGYANQLIQVDRALLKSAAKGDTQAAKLIYQRFEAWSEKSIQEISGSLEVIQVVLVPAPEHNETDKDEEPNNLN